MYIASQQSFEKNNNAVHFFRAEDIYVGDSLDTLQIKLRNSLKRKKE